MWRLLFSKMEDMCLTAFIVGQVAEIATIQQGDLDGFDNLLG